MQAPDEQAVTVQAAFRQLAEAMAPFDRALYHAFITAAQAYQRDYTAIDNRTMAYLNMAILTMYARIDASSDTAPRSEEQAREDAALREQVLRALAEMSGLLQAVDDHLRLHPRRLHKRMETLAIVGIAIGSVGLFLLFALIVLIVVLLSTLRG